MATEGQAAEEHGDEGGEQEALGTIVYEDPPVVYSRSRGTRKDSVELAEGQLKRQMKFVVAKWSKPL